MTQQQFNNNFERELDWNIYSKRTQNLSYCQKAFGLQSEYERGTTRPSKPRQVANEKRKFILPSKRRRNKTYSCTAQRKECYQRSLEHSAKNAKASPSMDWNSIVGKVGVCKASISTSTTKPQHTNNRRCGLYEVLNVQTGQYQQQPTTSIL